MAGPKGYLGTKGTTVVITQSMAIRSLDHRNCEWRPIITLLSKQRTKHRATMVIVRSPAKTYPLPCRSYQCICTIQKGCGLRFLRSLFLDARTGILRSNWSYILFAIQSTPSTGVNARCLYQEREFC